MLTLGAALATGITLAALPGASQADTVRDPLAAAMECRSIAADEARLACQDEALAALDAALESDRKSVV